MMKPVKKRPSLLGAIAAAGREGLSVPQIVHRTGLRIGEVVAALLGHLEAKRVESYELHHSGWTVTTWRTPGWLL